MRSPRARSSACSARTAAAKPRCSAPCSACSRRTVARSCSTAPRWAPAARGDRAPRRLRAAGARGLLRLLGARDGTDGPHRPPGRIRRPEPARSRGGGRGARDARHRSTRGRPFTEISGGERQLTLIARALAQEAGLLVMDEPTASLDFGNQVRVLERIRATRRTRHRGAVLDPRPGSRLPLRAARAAPGRGPNALALGSPREVIRSDTLEQLYRVAVRIVETEGGTHTCVPSLGPPS